MLVRLRTKDDEYRYLVSSHTLSIASKIWKKITNPAGFKSLETESWNEVTVKVMHLEDDDWKALEIIFNVIHLQIDRIPSKVSFDLLRKIAVVCDKYECGKVLRPWSGIWMKEFYAKATEATYEDWLFIARVLEPKAMRVKDVTRELILQASSKSACGTYFVRRPKAGDKRHEINVQLIPDYLLGKLTFLIIYVCI